MKDLVKGQKSDFQTIIGELKRVSAPREFNIQNKRGIIDYYHLGIKTDEGKRVLVFLSTQSLGWGGDINQSKIWYWNSQKGRKMKTSMSNPEKYLGKRMKIVGYLETIEELSQKYRMNNVKELVLFLD